MAKRTQDDYHMIGGRMAVIGILIIIASGWLFFPEHRENPIYPALKLAGITCLVIIILGIYRKYIEWKIENSAFEN